MRNSSDHDAALLTVNDVARRLRCHPHTVRRWIWSGKRRSVKVGSLVRVPQEEIDRFLNGGRERRGRSVTALRRTMRSLRAEIDPSDIKLLRSKIEEGRQTAEWTAPIE